ncbi:hypothetical protein, partial [Paraburkholderia fynbosensis]|uniref:hypothetical protein n=1 Tax=Paraburkholderia fynbosensis TaxID=1200993 RepID=UPI001C2EF43A
FVLSAAQLTHHDESLPSIDVFQDTEQSARRQTFSTQSKYSGHSRSGRVRHVIRQSSRSEKNNSSALNVR